MCLCCLTLINQDYSCSTAGNKLHLSDALRNQLVAGIRWFSARLIPSRCFSDQWTPRANRSTTLFMLLREEESNYPNAQRYMNKTIFFHDLFAVYSGCDRVSLRFKADNRKAEHITTSLLFILWAVWSLITPKISEAFLKLSNNLQPLQHTQLLT